MMNDKTKIRIKNAKIIFWDFDGVIKDSVPVKGEALESYLLNMEVIYQKKLLIITIKMVELVGTKKSDFITKTISIKILKNQN